jgi:glycosyltransferase involved in cell wall biosynthesis
MSQTAAVLYKRDGYDTRGQRLLGRQAAGEGFLKALARHGTADTLFCYTSTREEFTEFCQQIKTWAPQSPRKLQWLPDRNPLALAQAGLLYRPDAVIATLAWQRRFGNQRSYSLCGVTHTIASKGAMQSIGDLLLAPLQPWDALICTSVAVKTAVTNLLEDWAEYLAQRTGGKPDVQLQLPVIPLGVDCEAFLRGEDALVARTQLRQELGIAADDIIVLFVGRLIFYAKAHPVPMYLALEQAAQAISANIHLIQAGWFEDQREEVSFKESAKRFCPSVNTIFLDGRRPEIRTRIWSVADIFISLADNIQETFGLTPIEAMAAGLPVIVSDWNGYQESVRQGMDGFKIPTVTPPPGSGLELAAQYCSDTLNYSTYIAQSAIATSVDIPACTQALVSLIVNPDLRDRFGENGKERAKKIYDWQAVIAAYERLWQELTERRSIERMSVPVKAGAPPHPLCDDPCRLFSHYPTATLQPEMILALQPEVTSAYLSHIRENWMTNLGVDTRLPAPSIDKFFQNLKIEGPQTVAEILAQHSEYPAAQVLSTLGYLLKFHILCIESPP